MASFEIFFESPLLAVQVLLSGILTGAVFALPAYGMALVWGVMNIINIVQGEFIILGGFITVMLAGAGVPPLLGVAIATAALYVLGWFLYRTVIFRVVDRDMFVSLLATFGISVLMQQAMNHFFGADIRAIHGGYGSWYFFDDIVSIDKTMALAAAATACLGVGVVLFLAKSRLGRAIRATAQNPRAAKVLGVDTDRVYAATFALNAGICGAAGGLIAMIWVVQPFGGLIYTLRAFMIAVLAGLGNLGGVVVAALGIGIAENFSGFVVGTEFQTAVVFGLLVVLLLWRSYLLGRQRLHLK